MAEKGGVNKFDQEWVHRESYLSFREVEVQVSSPDRLSVAGDPGLAKRSDNKCRFHTGFAHTAPLAFPPNGSIPNLMPATNQNSGLRFTSLKSA